MDPLGKKGEEAFEGVRNVAGRVEELESRIEAIDSALQGFVDDSRNLMETEQNIESREAEEIEVLHWEVFDAKDRLEEVEKDLDKLGRKHRETERKLEEVYNSGIMNTVSRVTDTLRKVSASAQGIQKDIERIEKRMDELENNLMLEENKRDYDFDQKLDRSDFEAERDKILEEMKKLRSSINVLADEMNKKDEIEVE